MASAVTVGDPPSPEPPDPPDPPIPPYNFVQTSIVELSPLSSPSPAFHLSILLDLGSTILLVSSSDTHFAYLRFFPAVCSPRYQICSRICVLSVGVLAKFVGFSSTLLPSVESGLSSPANHPPPFAIAVWFFFDTSTSPPLPIPQVYSSSSNSSLLENYQIFVKCVALALWNTGLDLSMALVAFGFTCVLSRRPHIAFVRPFTALCRFCSDITTSTVASSMGLSILCSTPDPPYPSPAKTHVAHVVKSHRLLSLVGSRVDCSLSISINTPPLLFPQVCSCSSVSGASILESSWMIVESVALALWNSDLGFTPLMNLDILGSTFVPSCGTFIALVRTFTAVCRFYFELAVLVAALLQIGKRSLLSFTIPDFLVHRGFYSSHLSFKELIIFPNTSLGFSGIVTGSIVLKTVLLEVEARIVAQDCPRSAFADCLSLVSLEVSFPPFKNQSTLVELVSSHLSLYPWFELVSSHLSLYLCLAYAFVIVVALPFAQVAWFVWASDSLLYLLLKEE